LNKLVTEIHSEIEKVPRKPIGFEEKTESSISPVQSTDCLINPTKRHCEAENSEEIDCKRKCFSTL